MIVVKSYFNLVLVRVSVETICFVYCDETLLVQNTKVLYYVTDLIVSSDIRIGARIIDNRTIVLVSIIQTTNCFGRKRWKHCWFKTRKYCTMYILVLDCK